MRDIDHQVYEIVALFLQKGPTRVLLDPVAYDVPGTEGVVDLYLMPTYDDMASLYFEDGTPSRNSLGAARAELSAAAHRARSPMHHGVLVVAAPIDRDRLIKLGGSLEGVGELLMESLKPMIQALCEVSKLAAQGKPCCQ